MPSIKTSWAPVWTFAKTASPWLQLCSWQSPEFRSEFSLQHFATKIQCLKLSVCRHCFHYAHHIRHLLFWLSLSLHDLHKTGTIYPSYKKDVIAWHMKESLNDPANHLCTLMDGQLGSVRLSKLLHSRLVGSSSWFFSNYDYFTANILHGNLNLFITSTYAVDEAASASTPFEKFSSLFYRY